MTEEKKKFSDDDYKKLREYISNIKDSELLKMNIVFESMGMAFVSNKYSKKEIDQLEDRVNNMIVKVVKMIEDEFDNFYEFLVLMYALKRELMDMSLFITCDTLGIDADTLDKIVELSKIENFIKVMKSKGVDVELVELDKYSKDRDKNIRGYV